mmetsp:Transcript_19118/g.40062  ORF Transcript_19118/g.40062 Transcript_19118/m.40062 type:complete len:206 (+) Transcript_19118:1912-2529(+)
MLEDRREELPPSEIARPHSIGEYCEGPQSIPYGRQTRRHGSKRQVSRLRLGIHTSCPLNQGRRKLQRRELAFQMREVIVILGQFLVHSRRQCAGRGTVNSIHIVLQYGFDVGGDASIQPTALSAERNGISRSAPQQWHLQPGTKFQIFLRSIINSIVELVISFSILLLLSTTPFRHHIQLGKYPHPLHDNIGSVSIRRGMTVRVP